MWGKTRRKQKNRRWSLLEWVVRCDRRSLDGNCVRNFSYLLSRYLDLRHSLLSLSLSPFSIVIKNLISSIERYFWWHSLLFLSGSKSGRCERSWDHLCKFLYSSFFELNISLSWPSISRALDFPHVVRGEVVAALSGRSKFNEDHRSDNEIQTTLATSRICPLFLL